MIVIEMLHTVHNEPLITGFCSSVLIIISVNLCESSVRLCVTKNSYTEEYRLAQRTTENRIIFLTQIEVLPI